MTPKTLLTILSWLLVACQTAVPATPTPLPTITVPPTAVPAPTLNPDTGWQTRYPGLEQRTINLSNADGGLWETLYILRLDPTAYRMTIAYRPGQPQTLSEWLAETGALFVVNGAFFTKEWAATGLMVVDGQASGVSYGEFAGMLAITAEGPDLRWLGTQPYDPTEPLQYALQSFPVLVKPGGKPGFPDEDGQPSRRTVIAQDGDGRFLFIVAPWGKFTLHQLSLFLTNSDLNLEIALNLDGGTSSGLLWADNQGVQAMTAVPAVIAVYAQD